MNLKNISEAVQAYKRDASAADAARLDFFEGLFKLQQQRADDVQAQFAGETPDGQQAGDAYKALQPLLEKWPCAIDAAAFAETCAQVATHMVDGAGLDDDVAAALAAFDWSDFVGKLDLGFAGANPPQFVEACLQDFDSFDVSSQLPASIVMMVVSFALRAHIQPVAAELFAKVDKAVQEGSTAHPLLCPVCGSPAALSHVALATGIDGRNRRQYCSMCGTAWPFDRMRCGVCGTDNPTRLHYFHVEGDDAHRLQNCDECGQYQRVFFEESLEIPVALEVEDVVMAKLDRIALDPRFRA